jgi:hypothetical protein
MVHTANIASLSNSARIRKEAEIFIEYLQLFNPETEPANRPMSSGLLFVYSLSFYYLLLILSLFLIIDYLFIVHYSLFLFIYYYVNTS